MSDPVIRALPLGSHQANAYLLWREDRPDALLIDPGDDLRALQEEIRLSGKKLTHIFLTHGHFDHILAAAPLKRETGAALYIHPLDAHMLSSPSASLYNPAWCRLPFEATRPDEAFPADGGRVEACGFSFELMHTPGHTPGSVCLKDEKDGLLFTGDTLFAHGYGRTDFPGGSDGDMAASLDHLLGLEGTLTVLSGHGEADSLRAIARRWGRQAT